MHPGPCVFGWNRRLERHLRADAEALETADRLLADFAAMTVLADRGFPSAELLGWFEGRSRWQYVMRLRGDTEIHGTAAPLGCQVRRLRHSLAAGRRRKRAAPATLRPGRTLVELTNWRRGLTATVKPVE